MCRLYLHKLLETTVADSFVYDLMILSQEFLSYVKQIVPNKTEKR